MALRRQKFRYAPEFSGLGRFVELECLARMETAPGETIDGVVKVKVLTDTTTQPVLNSVIYDVWAFYVPHRMIWDDWEDFIMTGAPAIPTVTTEAPRFYEHGTVTRNQLFRLAYREVWNEYFRHSDHAVWTATPVSPGWTFQLQTYETRLLENHPTEDLKMPLDAGEINVTGLRRQMQVDRRNQRRVLYTARYSDWLREVGVDVKSALLERPEFLGHQRARVSFSGVSNTTGTNPGYQVANGYVSINMPINKKMFPEHGTFMVLGAMRSRNPNVQSAGVPEAHMNSHEYYYRTDGAEPYMSYPAQLIDNTRPGGELVHAPAYEHYRTGMDQYGSGVLGINFYNPGATPDKTADFRRYHGPTIYDHFFEGNPTWPEIVPGEKAHFGYHTWLSLNRTSPVLRRQP